MTRLQLFLNGYARRAFRDQADFDYLSARMNYRIGARQQFLWAGLQALEKYMKAILLFNGKSSKKYSHNLKKLLSAIKTIKNLNLELDADTEKTINLFNDFGQDRCLQRASYMFSKDIETLDRTVWHIRKYCQFFEDDSVGRIRLAKVKNYDENIAYQFQLINGKLETILKNENNFYNEARASLVWQNQYYSLKKRKTVVYKQVSSAESSPFGDDLDFFNQNKEEIGTYIQL